MEEFVTKSGRKVKKGDKLTKIIVTPYGVIPFSFILDNTTIPYFIKEGTLKEVPSSTVSDNNFNIEYCVKHLAKRIKWNAQNTLKYLNNLYNIYPAAVFSVILRELAIMLDEKYPNHIENSKEIWIISTLDGEIKKVPDTTKIKNFRNFAAFRTLEDAKIAKGIMKETFSDLFSRGGKQKD